MSGIVALATRNTEFYANRVFDPLAIAEMRASLEPMATPWPVVHSVAADRGLRLITADRVEAEGVDPRDVLLLAYDWTPDSEKLLYQGAKPAALVSFEPPVIAWWLYYHLGPVSLRFPHTFLFEGARERVAPTTRFHPLHFPQPQKSALTAGRWHLRWRLPRSFACFSVSRRLSRLLRNGRRKPIPSLGHRLD